MADDPRQPLLASSDERGGHLPALVQSDCVDIRKLGSVETNTVVTVTGSEIRAAASTHPSHVWMHGSLITPQRESESKARLQDHGLNLFNEVQKSVQVQEEEEIRELLIDHAGHHCCWGRKPARRWSIQRVEDCSSYVGTLETFIEERDVVDEIEPYKGGNIDGKDKGRMPDPWEVDMKAEIPLLFVSGKEARKKIPHSEVLKKCEDCSRCGDLPSSSCKKPKLESRYRVADQMVVCSMCSGRGFTVHMDGSDTICKNCKGEGKIACCGSQGRIRCARCCGGGAILHRKVLLVRWRTIVLKRVCATKNAMSVPDEVFHRAKGVQFYQSQSYQCEPAHFLNSSSLSRFSESIIAERVSIPHTARIICERHQISLVPVTRVVMTNRNKSFKFYIIGLSKEIYAKDYPARCCCGICNIC